MQKLHATLTKPVGFLFTAVCPLLVYFFMALGPTSGVGCACVSGALSCVVAGSRGDWKLVEVEIVGGSSCLTEIKCNVR